MAEASAVEGVDPTRDHVVCLTCGFAGTVPRGSRTCPDCIAPCIVPMNPLEREGFEAGTLTHLEHYFENSCAPLHPKKPISS